MSIEETLTKTPVSPQWHHVGIKHHHGINLPLSALHSENSCGIGEFYDLIPIIDWCHKLKLDVIQLLPLNDTGDDPSPYFALSALALNPLFLSFHKLPHIQEVSHWKKKLGDLRALNSSQRVAYHLVQSHKYLFLRTYFEEVGGEIIQSRDFEKYLEENEWVETYGLFKVLKDLMSKNHWTTWPKELQRPSPKEFDELIEKNWVDVCFYIFLQYLCYKQITDVKAYANEKGVFIKGDIPILISPDSADVWKYQDEFDLSYSAGHPPDVFNAEGQVWGLPIFKWDVMKNRHYDWWKKRLSYASHFYDIYRIDHVLGFYRIWAIPIGYACKDGQYIPEDEARWIEHGSEILSILSDFSPMLPIAEDLGIISNAVRESLSDLGICGTKVMRWERYQKELKPFIEMHHYNPISMTTVSTHDSETLDQWWRDLSQEAKDYAKFKGWDYTPKLGNEYRRLILWESHHSSSLFHVNLLGEYLALFPELVAENPDDERINIPGYVLPTNWVYRFRPSVEQIVANKELAKEIEAIVFSPTPQSLWH